MIFTFLISIVFIAELIIAIALLKILFNLDKKVLEINLKLVNSKDSINEICVLAKKISVQLKILSQDFVDKVKNKSENILLKEFSKILISITLLNLNFKIVKKMKKSKLVKTLVKGFNLIENMV